MAVEPGGGVAGSPFGRFAGTALAGAVSSGGVGGGRLGLSARAVAVVAEAVVVDCESRTDYRVLATRRKTHTAKSASGPAKAAR